MLADVAAGEKEGREGAGAKRGRNSTLASHAAAAAEAAAYQRPGQTST